MNRFLIPAVFAIGLITVGWVGVGFIGSSWLALAMTLVIAAVYLLGAWELKQFRMATSSLAQALSELQETPSSITTWLARVSPSLQIAVRLRIEGERVVLPGPPLTPYLVGLLVMLGMLGTFLGMVVTFKGAVFALEGSADLQAVRSALAAPIKGLGLSFGTSVAGVAASAMLGLLSAVSRRERLNVGGDLDRCIATVLRTFSRAHQRDESFKALQLQASALPDVVSGLNTLMEALAQRNQQQNEELNHRQEQFHRQVVVVYTDLATSVGQSLHDSLAASSRIAVATLQPVVQAAMAEIASESRRRHEQVSETVQAQLTGIGREFSTTSQTVSDGWKVALQDHVRTSDSLVQNLDRVLVAFNASFEQRSVALLATVAETVAQNQANHQVADQQRLQAWSQALQSSTSQLQSEWQRSAEQTQSAQQVICQTLQNTATHISANAADQAKQTLENVAQILGKSEILINSRLASEAEWSQGQGQRMDELASLWRRELGALREEEAARGQAAVDRLGELQAATSQQLATLGTALEEPLTRLMQTASEAPQAAAALIAQLRQEMTRLSERENVALSERAGLMARLSALMDATDKTSVEQRSAIEALVGSAAVVLEKAGNQFAQILGTQTVTAEVVAAEVSASAIELAALGESFHLAVRLFNEGNDRMVASLQSVEAAVSQSMQRSDEQLAYYVGQAREVIDLSLSSQKAVVEDLRRLHGKQVSQPKGVSHA